MEAHRPRGLLYSGRGNLGSTRGESRAHDDYIQLASMVQQTEHGNANLHASSVPGRCQTHRNRPHVPLAWSMEIHQWSPSLGSTHHYRTIAQTYLPLASKCSTLTAPFLLP